VVSYQEYRCVQCKKLLFKGLLIEGEVEVKCRHCHGVTTAKASQSNEYLCAIKRCPNRIVIQPE